MTMGDEKQRIDLDTAILMQDAGLEKPPEIPQRNYHQIRTISKAVHETIAFMLARGMTQTEVAETIGMEKVELNLIANSERMKFEVKMLTYKLFGRDIQKKFKEILPEAVECAAEVMRDPKAKPAVKLGAAINFMDRALGKPKQSVEMEGSLIRQLFEKLDKKKTGEVVEVIDAETDEILPVSYVEEKKPEVPRNPNEEGKKDQTRNPNLNPDFDKLEVWVNTNL